MSEVFFVACSNDYLVLNCGDESVGLVYQFDEIVEKCTPAAKVEVVVSE